MTPQRQAPTLRQLAVATMAKFLNVYYDDPRRGIWYPQRRVAGSPAVTPYTAMNYSAVWACMRVIAETLAMVPWTVFEAANGQTIARPDNGVNYLLSRRPNPDVPAIAFRETLVMQLLAWGNAYAEIQWDNAHRPIGLWHIPSDCVRVDRDSAGNLIYIVYSNYLNPQRTITADNILHFRNVAIDGVMGLSTISVAANTISYGQELQQFGAVAFKNAAFLSGWMQYPGRLPDEESADSMKRSWREKYLGWLNAGEVPILESGMEYHQLQLPLQDAQFMESQVFQAQEVCRWFRVPQFKVGLLEEASYSNIEALAIDFYNETLLPMTIRLQEELDYKLFEGTIRTSKFFTQHDLTPILRGDLKTRYEAYSIGLRYGFLSINQVLQMEGLDEISGGELRTVQLNTVPLEQFMALAQVKLEQAQADVEYREAQTEQLEKGIAAADAAASASDATDANAGGENPNEIGDPISEPMNPNEAANTPVDDVKAGTQAATLRRLRALMTERERVATALAPKPNAGLRTPTNGISKFRTSPEVPGGRRAS